MRTEHYFHVRETRSKIVDSRNNEVIARYVDFDTDLTSLGLGVNKFSDYKIWMYKRSCEKSRDDKIKFMSLLTVIERKGEKK